MPQSIPSAKTKQGTVARRADSPQVIDLSDEALADARFGFDHRAALRSYGIEVSENPFQTPPRGLASGLQPHALEQLIEALAEGHVIVSGGPGAGKYRLGEDLDAWVHDPSQPEQALMNPKQWPLSEIRGHNPCAVIEALRMLAESTLRQAELPEGRAKQALAAIRGLAGVDSTDAASRVMTALLGHLKTVAESTNRLLLFQLKDAETLGREHLAMLKDFLKAGLELDVPIRIILSGSDEIAAQLHEVAADEVPLVDVELSAVTSASERDAAIDYLVSLTSVPTADGFATIPFTESAAGFLFDRSGGVHALINEIGWVAWDLARREGRSTVEPAEVQAADRAVRASFAWLRGLPATGSISLHGDEDVAAVGREAGLTAHQLADVDCDFLENRSFIGRDAGGRIYAKDTARTERIVAALEGRALGS